MDKLQQAREQNLHPSVEDLRSIKILEDLPQDSLEWLAGRMLSFTLEPGDITFQAGQPIDYLSMLFEGELRAVREDGRIYTLGRGEISGLLPYSRMKTSPGTGHAELHSRGALLHKDEFPGMMERLPILRERLVNILADRIRETAKADQQHEKLLALGKLSAGLAHELNNPAAAARRSTDALRQAVSSLRTANKELEDQEMDADARCFLAELDCNWARLIGPPKALDTLDRSEQEELVAEWIGSKNISEPWELAANLVDSGGTLPLLEEVASHVPAAALRDVLRRISASLSITRLLDEIESSTAKISELVKAIKEYSYMDQSLEQDVDIHQGIENTLVMLKHRLKQGVDVERKYDESLPKVNARGSELNQIWTNLIVNAIDAMNGKGKLLITTQREALSARVDVVDNGPGIPEDVQPHIFEPFFTTKPVGDGTGLGLDAVFRIVRTHRGNVDFESRPGETRFIVRIPLVPSAVPNRLRAAN